MVGSAPLVPGFTQAASKVLEAAWVNAIGEITYRMIVYVRIDWNGT